MVKKSLRVTATLCLLFVSELVLARTLADLPAPSGFKRSTVISQSYAEFLRNLPLKETNEIVMWDGEKIPALSSTMAVVGLPLLFSEDLEQCADYAMRLWAEYLRSIDALASLSLYDFYGNKKPFSSSGKGFNDYLNWHMKYSNSYSIKLGGEKVNPLTELSVGDMIVQNDSEESIGHVSVILDEAVNSAGRKVYLLGYSFMPAQEFHIEKAGSAYGFEGWFTDNNLFEYVDSAFGAFGEPVVRRFAK